MLPASLPDLTLAVEVSNDTNDNIDIDNDAMTSVRDSDIDIVDTFDLPYNMRNVSASTSSVGGGSRVGRVGSADENVESIPTSTANRNDDNSGNVDNVNINDANPLADPETAASEEFDRRLVELGSTYIRKIGTKCIQYVGNYCWDILSYDNISDEFLLKISGGCGVTAAILVSVRDPLSSRLGPNWSRVLHQVNNSLLPILTSSTMASSFLYICKSLSSHDASIPLINPLIRRGSRELSRVRIVPQFITVLSVLIALFTYKSKLELGSISWLIKIWTSRLYDIVRKVSNENLR